MKLLSTLKGIVKRARYTGTKGELDDYWYHLVAIPSLTGVEVDETTAIRFITVWACVRVISETIASLPLHVYKKLKTGGKEKAADHPLYKILHYAPNPEMTAFQFREAGMANLLLWGNWYSWINRDRTGDVIELWPLNSSGMKPERTETGQLRYKYNNSNGQEDIFPADEILHVPGLGFNGLMGYPPLTIAREGVGLGLAAEQLAARFYSNDATPGGVLEHPGKLSPEAQSRLKQSWIESQGGIQNKWSPAILEEGLKWNSTTMPFKDAQFLESRKFQTIELCRFFNLSPTKVQDWDRATFSNVEQVAIDFAVHTIRPWLVRLEQAFLVKLFRPTNGIEYFAEHLIDGLLRGDSAARASYYNTMFTIGAYSINDILELENKNPIEDGDKHFVPMNMQELGAEPVPTPVKNEPAPEPSNEGPVEEEDDMSKEEREHYEILKKEVLKIPKLEKECEMFRQKVPDLEKECGILKQKLPDLETSNEAFKLENSKLVQERADLEAKMGGKDALIQQLGNSKEHFELENKKLAQEMADLSGKISEKDGLIQKISEEREGQVDTLNGSLVAKDAEIQKLNGQMSGLNQSLSDRESEIKELRTRLSSREVELQDKAQQHFRRLFDDAVSRIIRRESIGIKRALKRKDLPSFNAEIDEFYQKLPEFASSSLHPAITSYAMMVDSTAALNCIHEYIPRHVEESKGEISKWVGVYLHDSTDFRKDERAIDDCLEAWIDKRTENAVDGFIGYFAST